VGYRTRALLGFAGFGLFWGAWGAALPLIQSHAGASDSQLGLALLCIGAGALVSMRPAGVLVDRLGPDMSSGVLALFAGCALLPALATSPLALAGALLVLGAVSGAVDVAINAEAAHAEAEGRPAMNLAHAVFSAGVVGASVLVGVLRTLDAGALAVLGTMAVLLLAIDVALTRIRVRRAKAPAEPERLPLLRIPRPLLVLGALAALAYLAENAWQSWSAVHLESDLGAAAGIAALGPAVFGASAVAGRLGGHALASRVGERSLLAGGAAIGSAGTLLAALAGSVPVALAGIAIAGIGMSVCAPTLLGLAGRLVGPDQRGSAVSAVTTLAYAGFLVGPAAVGLAAGATSLPAALAGVAGVAALLAVLARFAPVPRG
jgi:predicted MFS family arabinose efflux permease